MLRFKIIMVVSFVFLLFSPGKADSQTKPPFLFDVLPTANHTVLTQWSVPPGMDSLPFELERSRDNSTWKKIASVPVQPSHRYSSTDEQPGEGLIYYRIRQVGGKGKLLYSWVNWVQFSETGKLFIWPNPAKNMLHVKTPYINGRMDIINTEGREILKITITNLITDVPTIRLSKGIYVLHVRHENEMLVGKFVKD
ncbi:MAG: hypothetical protein JWR61_630 [Ferruginibacter sp.]|uniref:T9SS type A sorting domain-containing protein n=1 Tax=Ferruginibacter sp. TaxID=1940288 RepID=UPI002657FBA7|nr:T9SS type A sorting domain-containing protein [Ferruginibacter sp.]MDB5275675.1 hypothetical protein [Ferruginibacter sp.]